MDIPKMWTATFVLALYSSCAIAISSVRIPEIEVPTLEDLQRGVGIGDPTDQFKPVIKMKNGKIKEESREQLEQYRIHRRPDNNGLEDNGEPEILRGQMAYMRLVQALKLGDKKGIKKGQKGAAKFMENTGFTLEDAKNEARGKGRSKARGKGRGRAWGKQNNQRNRHKRYIAAMDNGYWDKCIVPYEYGEGFTDYDSVKGPMQTYELYTGFRFVKWNESVPSLYGLPHNNRIQFIDDSGCWSYVGNLRGSGQQISCCSGSSCVHELGHALGFDHEQKSPLRDDYLRVEWDGTNPEYWSQYTRTNNESSLLFGYYDPTSVMHYWNGVFDVNYKNTMYTLDTDRDFLLSRDTSRYFYFFKEAMEKYKCFDLFCNESLTCENGGFPSVVNGECECICPYGLNPKTRCASVDNETIGENQQWPAGSFTTFNTVDGCPDGFELGWQYHKPPNYIWGSTPYNAKPAWSWWHAEHEFCSRIDIQNNGTDWPAGSYCIFRKGGSCPNGFEVGYIQMDDVHTTKVNTSEGELPDGVYGNNTRWEFCCRSDSPSNVPIQLPIKDPFILFYKANPCQKVEGMQANEEYINWRSDTADGYNEINGSVPYYYQFSKGHFNLYFCYYSPVLKNCGGIYTLNSSHATNPLTIKSINYPNPYGKHIDCSYTIRTPENTTIQLDFDDFDIGCASDNLEVAFSLPGHFGRTYCGSGFDKTVVSSENYMRLTLRAGNVGSSKGFSAKVKVIDGTCFTKQGKDRSYSGDVSFTQNFELCLLWNEVQNCRFHRFAPETFDDDLSENFCRNTVHGTGPWCYTNAETCARDYCDACTTRSCYDLFDDCAALIANDTSFCSTNLDEQALRGCRRSCGECKTVATGTTCPAPGNVDNIIPTPAKTLYSVGDQVEYKCPTSGSNDVRTRTCTSRGTWTYLGFVCGACPEGWGRVDGKCYKWFDKFLIRDDAKTFCEGKDAKLAVITSQKQHAYVNKIVQLDAEEMEEVWIALKKNNTLYEWEDGTALTFTGWKTGEPDYWGGCVTYDHGGWESYACGNTKTFVCMHTPSERTTCADQSSRCEAFIRATPDLCVRQIDFANANCPYSCGLCKDSADSTLPSCIYPGIPIDTKLLSSPANITVGQIYEYQCNKSFALSSGDLIRACLITGQLTGSTPICNPDSTVEQPVNGVNIRRRDSHGSKGYIYTAINKDFNITKTGNLTKWRFYSSYNGDISLQVWRFAPGVTTSGQFIGKNTVNGTGEDRVRTIEIPGDQQIQVQNGDVIAVHYPSSDAAGIPFTRCSLEYEPSQNNQLKGPSTDPSSLVKGNNYTFVNDYYDCKTWSLNAFIK